MQIASCEVRLSGDLQNSVPMARVTVAEIAILRAIHGAESINKIVPLGNDRRSHSDEFRRLATKYTATNKDGEPLVALAFPGLAPRLPVSFRDIGIELDDIDGDAVDPAMLSPEEQTGGAISSVKEIASGKRSEPGEDFTKVPIAPPQRERVSEAPEGAPSATAIALAKTEGGDKDVAGDGGGKAVKGN